MMSLQDYSAWAAKQYGTDPGLLAGIAKFESGWRPGAVNNWDSNAQAGTPSKGVVQYIESTFLDHAKRAQAANPAAWAKFGGKLDWTNPQQQLLAASWGLSNGKGPAWATYDRARQYAQTYNYQPKWRMGGVQGATTQPAVNPQQLAAVKADFDKAIQFGQQQVKDATQRVGRFDALTDEQKQQLNYRYGAREAQNMDMRQRSAMAQGLTAAQQNVADMRSEAKSVLNDYQAAVVEMQRSKNSAISSLKAKRIAVEAQGLANEVGWNGQGSPFKFLEKTFGLRRSSGDHDAPGVHTSGSFHYRPAAWGGVQAYDYGDARNNPEILRKLGAYIRNNYQRLGVNEFFYDPLDWYIDGGRIVKGQIGGHGDHAHLAFMNDALGVKA